jgi:endonuclease III
MVSALEKPARKATRAEIEAVFQAFQHANPNPTTELEYDTPFQLVLAVLLSAQTTDVAVNKATRAFFSHIKEAADLLAWGEDNLREAIQSIGLYRTKAANAMKMAQLIVEEHGGQVPRSLEVLQTLPGVGLKTASVVANTLWGEPLIAVDTHVFRVARRLGLSRAATPEKMAAELPQTVPPQFVQQAHHWLILHGRYTCTARNPACHRCPVDKMCHAMVKVNLNHYKV